MKKVVVSALLMGLWAHPVLAQSSAAASKAYEDALQRYEKKDFEGAVLQLKNALQVDKKFLAAHLLLGKVLLGSGQLPAAQVAFEEALRQGVDRSEVMIPLGQIYLQLGETAKLLEQLNPAGLPPTLQAEVYTLRGSAQASTGGLAAAVESFAQARAADPRSASPLIAEVPFLLRSGERDKARATAQKATELAPQNFGAWYMLGIVLQTLGSPAEALGAYDRALSINDKHVDSRVGRASALMLLKREPEAKQVLDQLKAAGVQEPRAAFLRGNLAASRGDANTARAEYNEAAALIDALPPALRSGNEPLLLSGALSHRAIGNLGKTREYLETLLARNGRHLGATMLLASVLLEQREYAKAGPLVDQLQRALPEDPQVLYLSGVSLLGRKLYAQAAELFARAAARGQGSNAMRELGIAQLNLGRDRDGITSLEQAYKRNPSDVRSGVELAMAYLHLRDLKKAVEVAEQVTRAEPNNLEMLAFLGNVKGRTGDRAGARAAWDAAVARDPQYRPALSNLIWMDIEEGKFDPARARIQSLLAKQPNDPGVLYQAGVLEQRARRYQEAINLWVRADGMQRQDPRPGLAIVELMLSQRVNDQALIAAKRLNSNYPDLLPGRLVLARAYIANGDPALAKQTLGEASRLAGFDVPMLVDIGRLQLGAGNPDGAGHVVTKALQAKPDDLGALVLAVDVEAARRNPAKVDAALKALTAKHPQAVATLIVTGHVAMSRGRFADAQALYRQALDREPGTGPAILLAQSYVAAKQGDKGATVLEDWLRRNPSDLTVQKALAEVRLGTGKLEAARDAFKAVLAVEPDDTQSLISLAGIQQRLSDPSAKATAERALASAPGNAAAATTLGWILVEAGQLDAGIRHLRDARLRDPQNGAIRLRLADALGKAGRTMEARDELAAAQTAANKADPEEWRKVKARWGL